ncbi:hypothetical protein BDQ17DRAFT_1434673 [Cyathus striatus]|nr:hypothetical protein BDQ17DRAFT_1434673 [Cyathus striatus]
MAISYMPQPDDVSEWSMDTVEEFLKANRIAYNIHPWHIAHIKEKQVDGKILLTLEVASLLDMGVAPGGAVGISFLVRDLKKEKGMWVCPPVKRKIRILPSDDDIRPRIKQRKIVTMSHSSIAKPSTYEVIQQDPEQRILDDLPQEVSGIPPISLLYDGFGEFLDIVDGRVDVNGFDNVNIPLLEELVDDLLRKWTEVKFYAILSLDAQFRIVSLTPGLSCNQSSSDGRERTALYRAFTAASVLQARIHADIIQSNMFTMESRISLGFPPYPNSVDGKLKSTRCRNLYYARTAEDERYIIVKFARQYCPELHSICAEAGHAPELLAYEYLPGGWFGVAMEELGAVPISLHKHIADHFSNWERDLNKLVAEFHSKGYVHGDLRDANIISGEDGCVKLVDFDWAGRDGLVSYPIVRLNPELLDGRASRDRIIRKEDDMRILRATLAKVARMMYY